MYEKACQKRESEKIRFRVGRRKIERGILLVRGEVESVLSIEDAADVVCISVAVVRVVLVHREISKIPGVCGAVRTATTSTGTQVTHVRVIQGGCDDPKE